MKNTAKITFLLLLASCFMGVCLASGATINLNANFSAGALTATWPAGINFSGVLNGQNLALNDTTSVDQTMVATDATGSGGGWNVTAELQSPLADGPTPMTLSLDGSALSPSSATAPVQACGANSTCVLPTNAVSYPVAISSSSASTIYSAAGSSGVGINDVSNLEWWLGVPASVPAGNFSDVVTVAISSGP